MYVYKRDPGTSGKEVQCSVEQMHCDRVTALVDRESRNVLANLNPNIRLEIIEVKAGSGPRTCLGAGGEMGA